MGSQNGGIQHYVGKQNVWVITCVGIQIYWYSNLWVFKDLMGNQNLCVSRQNLWVVKNKGTRQCVV